MGEKPLTASLHHIKEQHADKGAIVYCAIMASVSIRILNSLEHTGTTFENELPAIFSRGAYMSRWGL